MKPVEWKTYRTRFLVKAKRLSSALSFTDHLGRQHCGRKGDYLVESAEGVLSIAPRQIFEDIYVPMPSRKTQSLQSIPMHHRVDPNPEQIVNLKSFRIAPLGIEGADLACPGTTHQPSEPARTRRKYPQSLRTPRTSPQMSLM